MNIYPSTKCRVLQMKVQFKGNANVITVYIEDGEIAIRGGRIPTASWDEFVKFVEAAIESQKEQK